MRRLDKVREGRNELVGGESGGVPLSASFWKHERVFSYIIHNCSYSVTHIVLKSYSNWPTYPQLYVSGELIGGLDIVKVGV